MFKKCLLERGKSNNWGESNCQDRVFRINVMTLYLPIKCLQRKPVIKESCMEGFPFPFNNLGSSKLNFFFIHSHTRHFDSTDPNSGKDYCQCHIAQGPSLLTTFIFFFFFNPASAQLNKSFSWKRFADPTLRYILFLVSFNKLRGNKLFCFCVIKEGDAEDNGEQKGNSEATG